MGAAAAPMQWVEWASDYPGSFDAREGSLAHYPSSELDDVNTIVNTHIKPSFEKPTVLSRWKVAPMVGLCGDYALTKQQFLIARGWPSSRLRLAEVTTPFGEAHAVLLAQANEGWFVLDNRTGVIREPTHTGYKWVRTQSEDNPALWVEGGVR